MGIGALMVGIGSTFLTTSFVATGIGTIIAGAIGGAIVGAAIGGLTSAIMGGDIMKGVLFGAIGGAVAGGASGWAATAGASAGSASGMTPALLNAQVGATTSAELAAGLTATGNAASVAAVAEGAAASTIAGVVGNAGENLITSYGGDFVKAVFGAYMEDEALDDELDRQLQLGAQKHKNAMELAAQHESSSGGGGGGAPDHAIELKKMDIAQRQKEQAELTRKYEQDRSDRLQGEEEMRGMRRDRQSLFKTRNRASGGKQGTDGKGIQEMRAEQGLASTGRPITSDGTALAPTTTPEPAATALAPKEEEKV